MLEGKGRRCYKCGRVYVRITQSGIHSAFTPRQACLLPSICSTTIIDKVPWRGPRVGTRPSSGTNQLHSDKIRPISTSQRLLVACIECGHAKNMHVGQSHHAGSGEMTAKCEMPARTNAAWRVTAGALACTAPSMTLRPSRGQCSAFTLIFAHLLVRKKREPVEGT